MNLDDIIGRKILVVGDIMLDRYVDGATPRLSPEAPVPVLKIKSTEIKLGGAANVACTLAGLGCQTQLIAVVGNDDAGREIVRLMDETDIITTVFFDPDRPTTTKTRYRSGNHQLLRIDEESVAPLSKDLSRQIVSIIESLAPEMDAIVLSDYAKGVLTAETVAEITKAEFSCPVIVDPKQSFAIYGSVSLITPNRQELFTFTGEDDVDLAAKKALSESQAEAILVTRSEEGMTLFTRTGPPIHINSRATDVVDVCGAGDVVVAAMAACMAAGHSIEESMEAATNAAAVVVGKLGTSEVSLAEMEAACHLPTGKLVTLKEAEHAVATWRKLGLKVGFTNGCYDLLHLGHVSMLSQCRKACNRLVVGVNSDASVRRLKGENRPIQSEITRASVVAALEAADLVIVFEDNTPMSLITALRPDMLFKGADYEPHAVIGADFVNSYGGKLMLIDLEEGHSTTSIIQRANATVCKDSDDTAAGSSSPN